MSERKTVLLVLVVLVLVGATSGSIFLSRWNRPLGPRLELPTYTPTVESSISSISIEATQTPEPNGIADSAIIPMQSIEPGATEIPTLSPTATSQPLCDGPASMTILAVGSDQRGTGYLYGLADSIHVVHIDFTAPKIMVIDFPRDLWVEIPEISDHYGITHGKINQAYLYGNPGMGYYDGPGEGPGLLARTLDLNFGLRVDHYIAIDTQTFVKIIDAVGGVDVDVATPIDLSYGIPDPGPEYFLSVGMHHLDGQRAYLLATNRIPTTFQRMKYQKIILGALREKVLSPDIIPQIPGLVAQFITSVQTDFTPREINSLICIAQTVPVENIRADSFPQEMFTATGIYDPYRKVTTFIYETDFDLIRTMVGDFMHGVWPFP